ncbi:1,4-dihydroxy-2-naphthoate polyprenyltransferase [Halohasta litorea]|uniref:1,4-dihydroxy-2-naphthoate octaprenyltransferase n=1 Tax=Halohasta litorea TaxID=869891 RepID=A0ABD6D5F2_9EURY|nr:1,4-dihydroxy-2-naphthoate polyprenyltransferase [Halohasta litorea]
MSGTELSQTRAWVLAARPQTLPAAAAPVAVGAGLAWHDGVFALLPTLAAFVGAALIQIGTNFANDYYDAIQGADTEAREGFTRVTQSGLIAPDRVKQAMYLTFAAAIGVGSYLVYVGGLPILVIGLLSVLSGIAYTGGPYPLGYHGLGDLFVFVFFGVIAVMGTYYVQATAVLADPLSTTIPPNTLTSTAFLASLPVAALSTNILVVNNIRDREEDATTGKRTLAVRFGYRFSRLQFAGLAGLAYAVPVWLWLAEGFAATVLLPLLTLPIAAVVTRTVWTETAGATLNPALETTGKLLAAHALLFGIGLAV